LPLESVQEAEVAVDIVVAADGSGDYATLQTAWEAAQDGDVIGVASGWDYAGLHVDNADKSVVFLGLPETGEPPRIVGTVAVRNTNGFSIEFDGFRFEGRMGAAVVAENAKLEFANCCFDGSFQASGSVIEARRGSEIELVHCTIYDQRKTPMARPAVNVFPVAKLSVVNSVLWSPGFAAEIEAIPGAEVEVQSSIVRGGLHGGVDVNPLLTALGCLTVASSARNAALPGWTEEDIHGWERPAMGTSAPDMGCNEFTDSSLVDSSGKSLNANEAYILGTKQPRFASEEEEHLSVWLTLRGVEQGQIESILMQAASKSSGNASSTGSSSTMQQNLINRGAGAMSTSSTSTMMVGPDETYKNLQAAWEAAQDGEVIGVVPGTYAGFHTYNTYGSKNVRFVAQTGQGGEAPMITGYVDICMNNGCVVTFEGFVFRPQSWEGAVGVYEANVHFENCLFRSSQLDSWYWAPLIYASSGSDVSLLHCTLLGRDTLVSLYGSSNANTSLSVTNSIIWNQIGSDAVYVTGQVNVTAGSDSIIAGGQFGASGENPLLNREGWLRDREDSPARGTAEPGLVALDMHGQPRAAAPDMGCREFNASKIHPLTEYFYERNSYSTGLAPVPTKTVDANAVTGGTVYKTLQLAWNAAQDWDIIQVMPGTYAGFDTGYSSKHVLFVGVLDPAGNPPIITSAVASNSANVMLLFEGFAFKTSSEAVYATDATMRFVNCFFDTKLDPWSYAYPLIQAMDGSNTSFVHCTLVCDTIPVAMYSSALFVKNSIVWNKGGSSAIYAAYQAQVEVQHSIANSGQFGALSVTDPLLTKQGYLRELSPARGKAKKGWVAVDIGGKARSPNKPDIGCFEYEAERIHQVYEYLRAENPHSLGITIVPTKIVDANAIVGGNVYWTLQMAWNAAQDGDVIKVVGGVHPANLSIGNTSKDVLFVGEADVAGNLPTITGSMDIWENEDSVVMFDGFVFKAQGSNAAAYVSYATVRFQNCLFDGGDLNSLWSWTPLIIANGSDVTLVHCTLFGNDSLVYASETDLFVKNSILWNRWGTPISVNTYGVGQIDVEDSIVKGGQYQMSQNDPNLTRQGWLTTDSPARNAAEAGWVAKDVRGQPRKSTPDMGCDEFTDTDGLGLPNWWQVKTFGGMGNDPEGDPFRCRLSNIDAYLCGMSVTVNARRVAPSLADGDFTTLQAAWNAAQDGEIIAVASGQYEGFSTNYSPKQVHFFSAAKSEESPPTVTSCVEIYGDGEDYRVSFDGFVFKPQGWNPAVNTSQTNVRFVSCLFDASQLYSTGIFPINALYSSNLSLVHCTLVGSESLVSVQYDSSLFVKNSILWHEVNYYGDPAIYVYNSPQPQVEDSVIRDWQGGGLNVSAVDPLLTQEGWLTTNSMAALGKAEAGWASVDIFGWPRPFRDAVPDIGCMELIDYDQDRDGNGIDDWWEGKHFGKIGVDPDALAPSGNGSTIWESWLAGTDPNDYYDHPDGPITPILSIAGGNHQTGNPDSFLPLALVVLVKNSQTGLPLKNAPVVFRVVEGGGKLAAANASWAQQYGSVEVRTDGYGRVFQYYRQPAGIGILSRVEAMAAQAEPAVFSTATPSVKVAFSPQPGKYSVAVHVKATVGESNVPPMLGNIVLRYTTSASEPSTTSPIFPSTGLYLTQNTTVRVRPFVGTFPGVTQTATYQVSKYPAMVSAGGLHSMALDENGDVWLWGANNNGQLGNGASGSTAATNSRPLPLKRVEGMARAVHIAAGDNHSALVDESRALWTWGLNTNGRLGDGTAIQRERPVRALFPAGTKITEVSCGAGHTMALDESGEVWLWGLNANGQLGTGGTTGATVANSNPLLLKRVAGMGKIKQISAGGTFSLALDENGKVWAWGNSANGRLGNGATSGAYNTPVEISQFTGASTTPHIVQISAGTSHSLAVDDAGNAWAWGLNTNGRLGDGSTTQRPRPEKITQFTGASSAPKIVQVSAGGGHSMAVDESGELWLWGLNDKGQLGNATTTGATIANSRPLPLNRVAGMGKGAQISAGTGHSLAADTASNVWGWGDNANGRLGDGTTATTRTTPVQTGWRESSTSPSCYGYLKLTNIDSRQIGISDNWQLCYLGSLTEPVDSKETFSGMTHRDKYLLELDPRIADTSGDGMIDGYKFDNGLDLFADNAFSSKSGCRIPNIWKYRHRWKLDEIGRVHDPENPLTSSPPVYSVGPGKTYATIQAAVNVAQTANARYAIIDVDPDIIPYGQVNIGAMTNKIELLLLGHSTAATPVEIAPSTNVDAVILNSPVVMDGFVIRHASGTGRGVNVGAGGAHNQRRIVNCMIRNNTLASGVHGAGIYNNGMDLTVVHCTLVHNATAGAGNGKAVYGTGNSKTHLVNSILWNTGNTATAVEVSGTGNYAVRQTSSIIRGPLLGADGTDPQLAPNGWLTANSASARNTAEAGWAAADIRGQARPALLTSAPDIGCNEFIDNTSSHGDGIPDWWKWLYGIDQTQRNHALRDYTGDRIPVLWKYMRGVAADATVAPDIVVDASTAAGGNIYNTLQEAWDAADPSVWTVIGVRPGNYDAGLTANVQGGEGKNVLWLSLAKAAESPPAVTAPVSIISNMDGVVIFDGFVFKPQNNGTALSATTSSVRLVNCFLQPCSGQSVVTATGSSRLSLVHCTLLSKPGAHSNMVVVEDSTLFVKNTIIWDPNANATAPVSVRGSGGFGGSGDVEVEDSIIRGGQYGASGGNPMLTAEGWLTEHSTAALGKAEAGWAHVDIFGWPRPFRNAPDIGCAELIDYHLDTDGNGFPDWWELKHFGHVGVNPNGIDPVHGITYWQVYLEGRTPHAAGVPDANNSINLKVYTPLK